MFRSFIRARRSAALALVVLLAAAVIGPLPGAAAATGQIAGTVRGPEGALLADDAFIQVIAYRFDEPTSNFVEVKRVDVAGNGAYTLDLSPGRYWLYFTDHAGVYAGEYWEDRPTIEEADVSELGDEALLTRDAELALAAHVQGTVKAAGGGTLGNVRVSAYQEIASGVWDRVRSVFTNSDGSYDLNGLGAGVYRLGFDSVEPNGYAAEFWNDSGDLRRGADIRTEVGKVYTGYDAELVQESTISGVITDAQGGSMEGARAHAYRDNGDELVLVDWTQTAADGSYKIRGLPTGTYTLYFDDPASGAAEWWSDKAQIGEADTFEVGVATDVTGKNAALGLQPIVNDALPTISGLARVGETLTASPGEWSPAEVSLSYRWLADGTEIPGADDTTYVPTSDVVGMTLTVRVSAHKAGHAEEVATSLPTSAVLPAPSTGGPTPGGPTPGGPTPGGPPSGGPTPGGPTTPPSPTAPVELSVVNIVKPKIKGKVKVGSTVKVTQGSWTPGTVKLKYKWLANGKAIKKATKRKFTITRKQRGKKLSVRVVGSATGYAALTVRTRPTAKVKP